MKQLVIFLLISYNSFAQNRIVVKNSVNGLSNATSSFTVYNIKFYGAVADNATDNTAAIQQAINAAHANGGGIVYIPSGGVFKTNQLESYTDVAIKGDGYISSFLKVISSDTLIAIHNLNNALNNVFPAYGWTNKLIEDVYLDGNSVGKVGFYVDRAANFTIGRTYITKFLSKGLILRNCLIGSVTGCYIINNPTGILSFADATNNSATTLVSLNNCAIYDCSKWGIEWSGGGQIKVVDANFERNGTSDTLTGCIYYHNNNWPGGLHVIGGWAEENLGTVIYIDANVSNYTNYPVTTTHSISDFQDLGQHYSFTKRNICVRGANQRLGIINSSITGAVNNVVADGVGNIVTVLNTAFDAANTNLTRNGATIVTK